MKKLVLILIAFFSLSTVNASEGGRGNQKNANTVQGYDSSADSDNSNSQDFNNDGIVEPMDGSGTDDGTNSGANNDMGTNPDTNTGTYPDAGSGTNPDTGTDNNSGTGTDSGTSSGGGTMDTTPADDTGTDNSNGGGMDSTPVDSTGTEQDNSENSNQ